MRFNNIEKDFEYCKRYQFEAIELKYNLIRNYDQTWIQDLICKYKIFVGSIGALQLPLFQEEKVKQQEEEKIRSLCEYAYRLNTEYVIVFPPRGLENIEWDKIVEETIKVLEKYSDIASEYNARLALEIMGFRDSYIRTIKDGLFVIDLVKRSNIGLVYDFYHVLGMGNAGQNILDVKPEKIYIVHVNDGMKCDNGNYADDNRLWPYDGAIDIERQLSMLKQVGYQGAYSMEVYQPKIWSFDMQECYRIAFNRMRKMEQFLFQ